MKKVQVALFAASLLVFAGAAAQAETVVEDHKPILADSAATPAVTPEPAVAPVTVAPVDGTAVVTTEVTTEVTTTTETTTEAPAADHDAGAHAGHDAESHEDGEKVMNVE